MIPDPDAVADCVLATFHQLPDKRKPRPQAAGAREWVPLAGVVLADKGTTDYRCCVMLSQADHADLAKMAN